MKLNNWHVDFFLIKHIFKRNSIIIKFELSTFIKIYSVFYIFFLSYVATDFLFSQWQESWEFLIAENSNWAWYVNHVLNFKFNKQYSFLFLKYYINWEDYFFIWKLFHLLHNCQNAFNEFYISNFATSEPHINSYMISHCQCHNLSPNLI